MFILNLPITIASPLALVAVSFAAFIGTAIGLKRKETRYRAALLMAVSGMPFTVLGVKIATLVSHKYLVFVFAICMLIVAYSFLVQKNKGSGGRLCQQSNETGRLIWRWYSVIIVAFVGVFSGLATGLLGVGGGFIIVPALKKLTSLSLPSITATSLCVISLTGTSGILAAWSNGTFIFNSIARAFILAVCTGLIVGRWGGRRLSGWGVSFLFSALLVFIALYMLINIVVF